MSVIILQRVAVHSAVSQDARLSVRASARLSHAGIVSKGLTILKLFLQSGRHTILVFHIKRCDNIPSGTPNGGVECRWGMKNRHFPSIYRFMSEIIQDRVIVTVECE